MPKVWTGGFPDNSEASARLCAQGSQFSLRGPSGEPASTAPGGGIASPGFACPVRALLPSDAALTGREASGPQTSSLSVTGASKKGMPSPSRGWPTGCSLPIQVESSLCKKCGVLLSTGSWHLADRYL